MEIEEILEVSFDQQAKKWKLKVRENMHSSDIEKFVTLILPDELFSKLLLMMSGYMSKVADEVIKGEEK